jgi:hypothetical protein
VVQLQHIEQYSELAVNDMLLSTFTSVTSDVHSLRTTYHSFAQSLPSRKELTQLLSKDRGFVLRSYVAVCPVGGKGRCLQQKHDHQMMPQFVRALTEYSKND